MPTVVRTVGASLQLRGPIHDANIQEFYPKFLVKQSYNVFFKKYIEKI